MAGVKELFSEKFRPKNLTQLIAPARIKTELSQGLVQNILLYGSAGTGKTSSLFILAENHPYLYINASSERGIDIIREKISKFCSTISLEGGSENLKCVILDEIDGATEEFFKALRSVMERYAATSRFIASCNHIQKVPAPVQSRFHMISYDAIDKDEETYLIGEYKTRVAKILDAIKVTYTDEVLTKFVVNDFPDMRTLVQKIQSFYYRGIKALDPKNFNINFDFKDLFDLCLAKPNPIDNYKFIVNQYGTKVDESLIVLGRDFPEYIKNNAPSKIDRLPLVIICVAEYQYQKEFVVDPMITLLACVFKIQEILK
ncbi:MAG: AAA family ATPase [Candidatus Methanofastidiosa archaeon]|nr:AAA family ATPase [Candidatus Methanofastidiosa archaeon]